MASPRPDGARLEPVPGWTRRQGPGYVIHQEPAADRRLAFAESVARGLEDHPRWLSCTFLYDAEGSALFEGITQQPEYYQTRTESAILERHAGAIREAAGDVTVVELGSGSSTKTRHILGAWTRRGPVTYVPIDVSGEALETACQELTRRFPELRVEGLASTYERALPVAATLSPLMLVFLGSTIGNFNHAELDGFLDMLAGHLSPGDHFLLGIDLVKDPARLERAYNDAAGWTARFTLNLFARMNRELGCRVPLDAVEHVAYYNTRLERIEIYARFRREVNLALPLLGRSFRLAAGEMILTEISRKFRAGNVAANLNRFGFSWVRTDSDPDGLFAVQLFRRRQETPYADERRRQVEARLRRTRARTLEIVAPLLDAGGDPAGRLAAEATSLLERLARREEEWLVEPLAAAGTSATGSPGEAGDPRGDDRRDGLRAALERLGEVRHRTRRGLDQALLDPSQPLTAGGLLHHMACEAEGALQEELLERIQAGGVGPYLEADDHSPPPRPERDPSADEMLIPGGPFIMGAEADGLAQDREKPARRVEIPSFLLDAAPVTNGRFLAFLEDDGYARSDLWSPEGWAWREAAAAGAPARWRREDGLWLICHFGRWRVLDPNRPVVHVSAHEAEAFARWAGRRLPTEEEWEKAAAWDPERVRSRRYPWGDASPSHDHANLDQRLDQPVAAGSYPRGRSFYGCHQMLGDVWEWTASPYRPYPGHVPFPDARRSPAAFDPTMRVLRGGSWATPAAAIRATSRRGASPGDRRPFAGFRCARDPSPTAGGQGGVPNGI